MAQTAARAAILVCTLAMGAHLCGGSRPNGTQQAAATGHVHEGIDLAAAAQAAAAKGGAEAKELENLLHWAIEHSDPDKLMEEARAAQDPAVVAARREEIQQMLEAMRNQASEADLMKAEIAELRLGNASDADRVAALERLKHLVEPIDNANDLKVLGGIEPLLAALNSSSPEVCAAAASTLGTAAANNMLFQQHVAQAADIVPRLLQVVQTDNASTAAKGIYALGTFLRNNAQQRRMFYDRGGLDVLQRLLTHLQLPKSLRNKVLDLIGDLAKDTLPSDLTSAFLERLVATLRDSLLAEDWDSVERVLSVAGTLAAEQPHCSARLQAAGLGGALASLRQALSSRDRQQDERESEYTQELLQLTNAVDRVMRGGMSEAASTASAAGIDSGEPGEAKEEEEQPVGMLGPPRDEL